MLSTENSFPAATIGWTKDAVIAQNRAEKMNLFISDISDQVEVPSLSPAVRGETLKALFNINVNITNKNQRVVKKMRSNCTGN